MVSVNQYTICLEEQICRNLMTSRNVVVVGIEHLDLLDLDHFHECSLRFTKEHNPHCGPMWTEEEWLDWTWAKNQDEKHS